MSQDEKKDLIDQESSRRDFIKKASIISLSGLGLAACGAKDTGSNGKSHIETVQAKPEAPKNEERDKPGEASRGIMTYRNLGNTGLRVSDISFGAGGVTDPKVVLNALDMGMNYFDTAPDYSSGKSETVLGKAFSKTSVSRDKFVVVTKMCAVGSYPKHYYKQKKETIIKGVEGSLKRLQTDYIDFLFVHALGERSKDPETYRLDDPEMLAAFEQLKKDGKVKHLGVSSHNYASAMAGGLDYAIDTGHIDLVMMAYNYGLTPAKGKEYEKIYQKITSVCKKAHDKGVAFVAMKTLKGAKGIDQSKLKGKGTYAQAAFKWVLSNPHLSTMIITIKTMDELNEYTKASGQKFSMADEEVLMKYAKTDDNCQIGCYMCEPSCPKDIHIGDILRYNMYFENYDQEKMAMLKYSQIPREKRGDACDPDCPAPCEKRCELTVPVREKLAAAHANLSFA